LNGFRNEIKPVFVHPVLAENVRFSRHSSWPVNQEVCQKEAIVSKEIAS
jgi:hypothetical protein